jgi:hypothetical protein
MRAVLALFGGTWGCRYRLRVRYHAVVTVTRAYVKNRRGGEPFIVEAFTEVICGDNVLGGVEATVLFSGDTRGTEALQPLPVVLSGLTVGQSAQSGCETEFECRHGRRVCQGQAQQWCGNGESKLLEGPCGLGRRIGGSRNGSELRWAAAHDV